MGTDDGRGMLANSLRDRATRYQWRLYNNVGVSPLLDIKTHGFSEEQLDQPIDVQGASATR